MAFQTMVFIPLHACMALSLKGSAALLRAYIGQFTSVVSKPNYGFYTLC